MNLYEYCGDDPVNGVDPSGDAPQDAADQIFDGTNLSTDASGREGASIHPGENGAPERMGLIHGVAVGMAVTAGSIATSAIAEGVLGKIAGGSEAADARAALTSEQRAAFPDPPTPAAEQLAVNQAQGFAAENAEIAIRGGRRGYFGFDDGSPARIIDIVVGTGRRAVGFEVIAGRVSLTSDIASQIASDAKLIASKRIKSITWVFYRNAAGEYGAYRPVLQALQDAGIGIVER